MDDEADAQSGWGIVLTQSMAKCTLEPRTWQGHDSTEARLRFHAVIAGTASGTCGDWMD